MEQLGVAIVSLGRCPPLLAHLCRRWRALGAEVSLVGTAVTLAAVEAEGLSPSVVAPGVSVADMWRTEFDPTPEMHGDAIALAFEQVRRPYVLLQADDMLPVGDWSKPPCVPSAIAAIRVVDMLGRRRYDWGMHVEGRSYLLAYGQFSQHAYITGAAQLWSPEARQAVTYRGKPFRTHGDVRVCWEALRVGISLVSPRDHTPLCVSLDRKDDRPDTFSDAEIEW